MLTIEPLFYKIQRTDIVQEMKPIDLTIKLPGNIETAWKWLTEESFQKRWMTGLQSLKRTDGESAYEAGSRWTMIMLEGKKLKTYQATMPEVDYPKRFTLSILAEDLAPGGRVVFTIDNDRESQLRDETRDRLALNVCDGCFKSPDQSHLQLQFRWNFICSFYLDPCRAVARLFGMEKL
jgi:uncharacterized protein YndB with AHSA1/START domain